MEEEGKVTEECRGFTLQGEAVWLTLTELQSWLSGAPTKHVMAVWEDGIRREAAKFNCPHCERRTYSERRLRFHVRLCHPEKIEVKEASA